MDDNGEFFTLKSFETEGIDISKYKMFKFRSKVTKRMFFIKQLVLEGGDGIYTHEDDEMCSLEGVNKLMKFYVNYSKLEKNLIKFVIKTGISLNFNSTNMKVLN